MLKLLNIRFTAQHTGRPLRKFQDHTVIAFKFAGDLSGAVTACSCKGGDSRILHNAGLAGAGEGL